MSENLVVGNIVEGKVVHIKPFGAIVSLGEVQGLVHISQVASSFVENINDHLKVDDTVKVKILSIDKDTNKISLSIRDALPRQKDNKDNKSFNKSNNKFDNSQRKPYNNQNNNNSSSTFNLKGSSNNDFEDKMKDWLKQSTERQSTLNKRANKKSY